MPGAMGQEIRIGLAIQMKERKELNFESLIVNASCSQIMNLTIIRSEKSDYLTLK